MKMEKTELKFEVFKKKGKYVLAQDYCYSINGYVITVPKGFLTDLASVPLGLRLFFPKDGEYTPAAVVHDYLYSKINNTGINRELADKIFNFIMKELNVVDYKRKAMYKAVRVFGELAWEKKKENEGYLKKAIIDKTEEAIEYYKKWEKILGKL